MKLTERGKVFFKDIHVNDVFGVFCQENGGASKKDDSRLMLSSTEAQCNTQSLNGTMGFARVF